MLYRHPTIFSALDELCRPFSEKQAPSTGAAGLSVSENEGHFHVDIDMPGVSLDTIHVSLDPKERVLYAHGEKKEQRDGAKYHMKSSQSYSYQLFIPREIDIDVPAKAELKEGVLSLSFQKLKNQQPLKIEVKGS